MANRYDEERWQDQRDRSYEENERRPFAHEGSERRQWGQADYDQERERRSRRERFEDPEWAGGAARNTTLLMASNTALSTAKASGSMALVTKMRALQHTGSEPWIGLTREPARTSGPADTQVTSIPIGRAGIESSA